MSGLCPFAKHMLIRPDANDPRIKPRLVIYHVDAGNASSLYNLFLDNQRPGGSKVEAHFFVKKNGDIEQYRDIYFQADANVAANDFAVSIETQGLGTGEWTPEQVASLQHLTLWLHMEAGIPIHKCQSATGDGVGYHRMFDSWNPNKHSCPGDDRVKQFERVFVPWFATVGRVTPTPAPGGKKMNTVERYIALVHAAKKAAPIPNNRPEAKKGQDEIEKIAQGMPQH